MRTTPCLVVAAAAALALAACGESKPEARPEATPSGAAAPSPATAPAAALTGTTAQTPASAPVAAAGTLRALCAKASACGCNAWDSVDACERGFGNGQPVDPGVVSCIGALDCDGLCRSDRPRRCVDEYLSAANAAARAEHDIVMKSIDSWPSGDTANGKCQYGYEWDGYNCVENN